LIPDYRDRLYESYASSHFERADSDRADPTFTHDIVRRLPNDLSSRILDVGCGSGRLVRLIRTAGYSNVRGIDTSAEQVAEAVRQGISGVEQADLFEFLQRERHAFDVVIATDVLEHLEKPAVLAALDALALSLGPGGLLIARTPNGASPFAGRYRYGDFTHETIFTPRSLRQILAVSGFTDVRVLPANPVVHGPLSWLRWMIWQTFAMMLKGMLIAEVGPSGDLIVTQNIVVLARRARAPKRDMA
jgi:2-polyprenyl-3-methyl-5-hydroxy-6-metoxy-1,4-benzoquinol methylase